MLTVSAVDDRGATHLGDFLSISIEHPAGNLAGANDVFDEEDSTRKSQRQLVEQLDVLQQVVVAGVCVAILVVVTVD